MKTKDILEIEFNDEYDLQETLTIRDYLKRLLSTLWEEGEVFSGKRPFGNSGWKSFAVEVLIKKGVIEGKLDDDYIDDYDKVKYDEIIKGCINELGECSS